MDLNEDFDHDDAQTLGLEEEEELEELEELEEEEEPRVKLALMMDFVQKTLLIMSSWELMPENVYTRTLLLARDTLEEKLTILLSQLEHYKEHPEEIPKDKQKWAMHIKEADRLHGVFGEVTGFFDEALGPARPIPELEARPIPEVVNPMGKAKAKKKRKHKREDLLQSPEPSLRQKTIMREEQGSPEPLVD
jgi:hypothetical protein